MRCNHCFRFRWACPFPSWGSGPPSSSRAAGRARPPSAPSGGSGSFREGLALVGPRERLGSRVVAVDEVEQLRLQVVLAGEDAASEQAAGEDREEELDLVEPGGVRGGEVEVPARVGVE